MKKLLILSLIALIFSACNPTEDLIKFVNFSISQNQQKIEEIQLQKSYLTDSVLIIRNATDSLNLVKRLDSLDNKTNELILDNQKLFSVRDSLKKQAEKED